MQKLLAMSIVGISITITACTPPPAPPPVQPDEQAPQIEVEPPDHAHTLRTFDSVALTGSTVSRFLASHVLELGAAEAANVLTVFTEYHCGYCQDFHLDMLPRLQQDFMESGQLRVRFVLFPLEKYPNSTDAAKALHCAGQQGQAEAMHATLFTRQSRHRSSLLSYAAELRLDEDAFAACLDDEQTQMLVDTHKKIAEQLEVSLVPTFFLNGEKKVGLLYYPELRGWINQTLTQK